MDSSVSLPFVPDMKYEENRLKSFEKGWSVSYIKPKDCASVGLFYLGESDKVKCVFCNLIISKWEEGDKPIAEHVKHSPMCPYLLRQDVKNVPITGENGLQEWQICNAKPERSSVSRLASNTFVKMKHPKMSYLDKRLQTFNTWPSNHFITPSDLAECGLFYSNTMDIVECFSCGGQMGIWDPTDDPWTEHAKHFPHCSFVKSIKGTAFIEKARSNYLSGMAHEQQPSSQKNPKENECKKLEALEITETSNEKFLCKICMEMNDRIVFVPCGHCLACQACVKKISNCPLCRKPIESALKLFFD